MNDNVTKTIGLIGAGHIGSHIAELDNESTTTSELLQAHLPTRPRSPVCWTISGSTQWTRGR